MSSNTPPYHIDNGAGSIPITYQGNIAGFSEVITRLQSGEALHTNILNRWVSELEANIAEYVGMPAQDRGVMRPALVLPRAMLRTDEVPSTPAAPTTQSPCATCYHAVRDNVSNLITMTLVVFPPVQITPDMTIVSVPDRAALTPSTQIPVTQCSAMHGRYSGVTESVDYGITVCPKGQYEETYPAQTARVAALAAAAKIKGLDE